MPNIIRVVEAGNKTITGLILVSVAAVIILLALVGFAYEHAPANSFHFDDTHNITENQSVQMGELTLHHLYDAGRNATDSQRPLPSISFAIDWWRGGGSPAAFLWTNVLIHGMATLAVFAFLLVVLRRSANELWPAAIAAFAGAALWATHPIQSQAVTYIVQRMTSMAGLFVVLSMLCYLLGRTCSRGKITWLTLSIITLVLGCLSKQNAVMGVFLLLLVEYGIVRHGDILIRRRRLDLVLLSLPLSALLLFVLDIVSGTGPVSSLLADYQYRDFTLPERLLSQPRVIIFHLGQILWPMADRFSLLHDFPKSTSLFNPYSTWLAILAALIWISAGFYFLFRRNRRICGFFLLFMPVALVPESTVLPLEMIYEHRMYLPSVAIAGLVAVALRWVLLRVGHGYSGAALVLVCSLALLQAGVTRTRVAVWKDEFSLWQQVVQHAPGSKRAQNNFGEALRNRKRLDEALGHFEQALAIDPDYVEAIHNTGRIYRLKGMRSRAYRYFVRAVTLRPEYAPAHFSLGMLFLEAGYMTRARKQFAETLQLDPGYPEARRFLDFARRYER